MSEPNDGGPFVFISYASLDRSRVIEIVDELNAIGVATWFDRSDIPGGTSYGPEIVAGIRDATALVLMCSETSLASRNVRQEIQLAWRHERPILPILLEPLVFPDDVSYWLEGAQWIEVLDQPSTAWLSQVRHALALMGYSSLRSDPKSSDRSSEPLVELPPNNLPASTGPLLGRDRELRHLRSLLQHSRIITLTGTGGSGKTRLAEEVARESAINYPDGIWFVDASASFDDQSLVSTIAHVLGVQESPGETLLETVRRSLTGRRVLLVLDNLEQVDGATPILDRLISIDGPTILATSRAPLKTAQEMVVSVAPLELPDVHPDTPASVAARNPAVQLFVNRARQVKPDFQLSDGNAWEVAAICTRLDGLPLAIELAAARSRLLNPSTLLARLDQRFNLLSRGSVRTERQQTLFATIAWSYDLLDPVAQRIFRRFSVFSGGATTEMAEEILVSDQTTESPNEVLDALDELLDQNLLQLDRSSHSAESSRVRMLETIRAFASTQLDESGESDAIRTTHAMHMAAFADALVPALTTGSQSVASATLAADQANLYAALDYLDSAANPELHQTGLALAAMLWRYWLMRSAFSEGMRFLTRALAHPGEPTADRARALDAMGIMAFSLGDLSTSAQYHQQALDMATQLRIDPVIAQASDSLGIVTVVSGDAANALASFQRAREHYERAGDRRGVAVALEHLAGAKSSLGELDEARAFAVLSLESWRTLGDQVAIGNALQHLGTIELYAGNYESAREYFSESLTLAEALSNDFAAANATANLASATEMIGDFAKAEHLLHDAATRFATLQNIYGSAYVQYMLGHVLRNDARVTEALPLVLAAADALLQIGALDVVSLCLETLAGCFLDRGHHVDAARLVGAADALRTRTGIPLPGNRREELDRDLRTLGTWLPGTAWEDAFAEGQSFSPHDALALASRLAAGP